jgi:3-carboxy-cis,cis-muconate cycloisomerase
MPHKRNPVGAALVLSAAARAPMLAATIVAALPQEHERALGGWQAEWPTLAALIETLGSAVQAMDEVAAGLTIEGDVLTERATFLLAGKMSTQKAGKLVEEALEKGGSFIEALGQLEKERSDEAALLGYSPKFVGCWLS